MAGDTPNPTIDRRWPALPVEPFPGPPLPPDRPQPPAGPAVPPPVGRRAVSWRLALAAVAAVGLVSAGAGAAVGVLAGQGGAAPAVSSAVVGSAGSATTATTAAAVVAPSVVTVYASSGPGGGAAGIGSGVVLSAGGYVLTNNHVVTLDGATGSATIQVRTADGRLHDATVVGTDPTSDLAVVQVNGVSGLTPATFADGSAVHVGDVAVAVGAPLGLSNTVTDGIVSATARPVATGSGADSSVVAAIQTDAAINPGNSGGPLVDAGGRVIGITSSIASVAQGAGERQQSGNIGVGFAIPAHLAHRVAAELIADGHATHAVLGVVTRTAADPQEPQTGLGAQVVEVTAGGSAASGGLRAGDVITAVDGVTVTDSTDLAAAVRTADPGASATLTVVAGGATRQVVVTLGSATD